LYCIRFINYNPINLFKQKIDPLGNKESEKVSIFFHICISENVNFRHPFTHDTPLHAACISPFVKRKSIVESLCRKGANLNDKNKEFLTPLHLAAEKSHFDVSKLRKYFLIKSGSIDESFLNR